MYRRFIKVAACAAGAGLAVSLGSRVNRQNKTKVVADDSLLYFEPLLDRIEALERKPAAHSPENVTEIYARIEQQAKEIERLKEQITAFDERFSNVASRLEARFEVVRAEVPALVNAEISAGFEEFRTALQAEFDRKQAETLAAFEAVFDRKISERLFALDRKLSAQSEALELISRHSGETEESLNKLMGAVERLSTKQSASTHEPAPLKIRPAEHAKPVHEKPADPDAADLKPADLKFETHLLQALGSGQVDPKLKVFSEEPRRKWTLLPWS